MPLFATICALIWVIALISLCGRRDIEIHSKLTWVVTVMVLNAVGAVIYFVFGPKRALAGSAAPPIDADAVPFTPEGESWNPILGENRLAEGEGLNPKDPATK
ncbi:MAG: PLDc_N domain-containing protein [Verrucomicrobia bacterium]|jgi:hypothetical protein|nr:PLDc_N domain-containing protein [Verrucomicrobiota bacterium]MBT7068490.1 PLDc_N domain-containing protein [Verrucomicrobiota bacterium]MBT7701143.1 PLDc_N domain-containing protein [Verrucomicrobiota bacterium]